MDGAGAICRFLRSRSAPLPPRGTRSTSNVIRYINSEGGAIMIYKS